MSIHLLDGYCVVCTDGETLQAFHLRLVQMCQWKQHTSKVNHLLNQGQFEAYLDKQHVNDGVGNALKSFRLNWYLSPFEHKLFYDFEYCVIRDMDRIKQFIWTSGLRKASQIRTLIELFDNTAIL
jgi:hypothetical protein